MEIRVADLGDGACADAWYEAYAAAVRWGMPFAQPLRRAEISEEYRPNLRRDASAWAGIIDGEVVCAGTLEMPLRDNVRSATVAVYVRPERRRLGLGSAMLAHLETLVRAAGRTCLRAGIDYPLEGPPDGRGWAGPEFALARGYAFGLAEVMRSLPMPVAGDLLADLDHAARGFHAGYRIETFQGRVPDAWVADYVSLESRISSDAPTGTLDIEPGSAEVAPFREGEERTLREGRESYLAVALHDERAVGFTKVTVPREDPAIGDQWGTLVDRAHRGHRLGLALKVANLRQLQDHQPGLRSIITWNAESNGPMIGVNEQLGYVAVQRGGCFEKRW